MWCTKDHGPTNSKRRRHGKSMKHLSIWRKQAYLGQAQAALQSGLAVSLPQLSCRLAALQTAAQSSGARELRGCNACVGAQPYAAHRAACRQRACNAVHTSPHPQPSSSRASRTSAAKAVACATAGPAAARSEAVASSAQYGSQAACNTGWVMAISRRSWVGVRGQCGNAANHLNKSTMLRVRAGQPRLYSTAPRREPLSQLR